MITLKCNMCGIFFKAERNRKIPLCEDCAWVQRKRGEGPIQVRKNEKTWSNWNALNSVSQNAKVPNSPGVYEVQTDFTFGRLNGNSPIIYIGSAATSLKKRLLDERIGKPDRYLSSVVSYI